MGRIVIETAIRAPQQRCFDLARDVSVHAEMSVSTHERVVAPGRLAGPLEQTSGSPSRLAILAARRRLTVQMVELVPPGHFIDEQISGPFVWMQHLHEFEPDGSMTLMRDTLHWNMPYGIVGRPGRPADCDPPFAAIRQRPGESVEAKGRKWATLLR